MRCVCIPIRHGHVVELDRQRCHRLGVRPMGSTSQVDPGRWHSVGLGLIGGRDLPSRRATGRCGPRAPTFGCAGRALMAICFAAKGTGTRWSSNTQYGVDDSFTGRCVWWEDILVWRHEINQIHTRLARGHGHGHHVSPHDLRFRGACSTDGTHC